MKKLLLILLLFFSSTAYAEEKLINLGVFPIKNGDQYWYDASKVLHDGTTVFVWIVTGTPKFNYHNQATYSGLAVRLAIDCAVRSAAFTEGMTYDANGHILEHQVVQKRDWSFAHFKVKNQHTIPASLFRLFCTVS